MSDMDRDSALTHLDPEEVDRLAGLAEGDGHPERLHAHLQRCETCRREVAFVRSLDVRLSSLPSPEPGSEFAAAVMARVRLPIVWHRRALATARQQWPLIAMAAAMLLAVVGGVGWWLDREGLAPGEVGGLALAGAQALMLRGAIAVGRVLYDLGVLDLGAAVGQALGPAEALAGLGLLSLLGLAALGVILRLMRVPLVLGREARA